MTKISSGPGVGTGICLSSRGPPALSATWAHCNFGMDILDGRTGLILICTYTSNLGITKDEGLVRQEGTGRIFPFIEHHGNSIPATSARM